jgi:hypothetical protein
MKALEIVMHYHRKQGTQTSYLREPGPGILPERIGFSMDGFTPVKRTGAACIYSKMGQVKADFKKTEVSPYKPGKALKPYIHFTLFWFDAIQDFGFANIAFAGESGKLILTNDLIIASFLDSDREIIELRLFPGQFNHRIEIVEQMRSNERKSHKSHSS